MIFSAYVLNYNPQIGEYHIWLCSILGGLLVILAAFTRAMWTHTIWPYYKDIIGGSKIVTTDSYLVASDNLYFLDDSGNEVDLPVSENISNELKARENFEI